MGGNRCDKIVMEQTEKERNRIRENRRHYIGNKRPNEYELLWEIRSNIKNF